MLMPCLLFQAKESCRLEVRGGTFVSMSPTVHPIKYVLLPHLQRMGIEASLSVTANGFVPDVVGSATLDVKALQSPPMPFDLIERGGDLLNIDIYVATTEGDAAI